MPNTQTTGNIKTMGRWELLLRSCRADAGGTRSLPILARQLGLAPCLSTNGFETPRSPLTVQCYLSRTPLTQNENPRGDFGGFPPLRL